MSTTTTPSSSNANVGGRTLVEISGTSLQLSQFPCLLNNYGFLLHDTKTGETAAIDTPWGASYKKELQERQWKLTHIFNTHHHPDHTMGNWWLKRSDVTVFGPKREAHKISCIDEQVEPNAVLSFAGHEIQVLDVGGHTLGHVAYYLPQCHVLFVGDALFAMGCGRMFEGTPEQYWETLKRLRSLPDETVIYCAHEYTQSNGKFALSVEPSNEALVKRMEEVGELRSQDKATVPTMMGLEKQTNPFLRLDQSQEIQQSLGFTEETDDYPAVFAALRKAKDEFGGPWWKFW